MEGFTLIPYASALCGLFGYSHGKTLLSYFSPSIRLIAREIFSQGYIYTNFIIYIL